MQKPTSFGLHFRTSTSTHQRNREAKYATNAPTGFMARNRRTSNGFLLHRPRDTFVLRSNAAEKGELRKPLGKLFIKDVKSVFVSNNS